MPVCHRARSRDSCVFGEGPVALPAAELGRGCTQCLLQNARGQPWVSAKEAEARRGGALDRAGARSRGQSWPSHGNTQRVLEAMMSHNQRVCARCVLDAGVPDVEFDEKGTCNYCKLHDEMEERFPVGEIGRQRLHRIVSRVKSEGEKKRYDCVVGVSGGTDSTYCLVLAKKLGLRPLAVHLDNGWDTEIAINNMNNVTSQLGIDLRVVKCDWEEFKDLQISFLKASVPDAEIPTDTGIKSVLYRVAVEHNAGYIISGGNFRTEGVVPRRWTYMDGRYIKSVHQRFGKTELVSFPNLTAWDHFYYLFVKRVKAVRLLNFVDYRKEDVIRTLEKELPWRYYGGHHYESVYTRFVSAYLLYHKFGIDKRKIEYAALVRSGQMTREEALRKLGEDPWPKDRTEQDIECVTSKLEMSRDEFEQLLSRSPKTFLDYPTYYPVIRMWMPALRLVARLRSRL